MTTFAESYDSAGKTIQPVTTYAMSGLGSTEQTTQYPADQRISVKDPLSAERKSETQSCRRILAAPDRTPRKLCLVNQKLFKTPHRR